MTHHLSKFDLTDRAAAAQPPAKPWSQRSNAWYWK